MTRLLERLGRQPDVVAGVLARQPLEPRGLLAQRPVIGVEPPEDGRQPGNAALDEHEARVRPSLEASTCTMSGWPPSRLISWAALSGSCGATTREPLSRRSSGSQVSTSQSL